MPLLEALHGTGQGCSIVPLFQSNPKVMFLLRALDTSEYVDLLEAFDSVTRGALSRILGAAVTDAQWLQAKLPLAMGGLGLKSAEDHAPVAYACSLLSSQPMVHSLLGKGGDAQDLAPSVPQPVLDRISAKQGDEAVAEALVGVPQKSASLNIDLLNQSILFNTLTEDGEVALGDNTFFT